MNLDGRSRRPPSAPSMARPTTLAVTRHFAHRAGVHHEHAIGEGEHFVEVAAVEQHRDTRIARVAQRVVYRCGGAKVETTRGILDHERPAGASSSARARTNFC